MGSKKQQGRRHGLIGVWVGCLLGAMGWSGCEISVTLPSDQGCQAQGTCKATTPPPKQPIPSPEPVEPDPKPPTKTCKEEPGLICPKDLCQSDKDCATGQKCLAADDGRRCVGQIDCGRLSELDCWKARPQCILVYGGQQDRYVCRATQNECEKLDAAACAEASQCFFDPGFCYCPPDVTCICGGGPPPLCQLPSALCEGIQGCAEFCRVRFRCCAEGATCTDDLVACKAINRELPEVCVRDVDCVKLDAKACVQEPRCQWVQLPVEPSSSLCLHRP
ncbi:hypothetical protein L6R29_25265 [Myxococcota bacterium]|nr:hypothetical protein [Myxococcota bacterium]